MGHTKLHTCPSGRFKKCRQKRSPWITKAHECMQYTGELHLGRNTSHCPLEWFLQSDTTTHRNKIMLSHSVTSQGDTQTFLKAGEEAKHIHPHTRSKAITPITALCAFPGKIGRQILPSKAACSSPRPQQKVPSDEVLRQSLHFLKLSKETKQPKL